MKIGYARVSTTGQNLDTQREKLKVYGCDKIYEEKITTRTNLAGRYRPALKNALDFAREGDIFVITKLDRLARSVIELVQIIQSFEEQKIGFVVIDQNIDTTTPTGRLMFHVLSAIGEFERELINERVKEGIEKAKEKGVKFGRKNKLTPKQLAEFCAEFENPPEGMSKSDITAKYDISVASGYRIAKENKI